MAKRLPPEAFTYYVGLGPERSYLAVAEHFGVSKQSVTRAAAREDWQPRLADIERRARESTDQKAAESLEAMNDRHLKTLRVIQSKALEALKSQSLTSAMDAVRALDMCISKERLVRGEPSDRTAISVEDVIRRQYDRWMTNGGEELEEADGDGEDA